MNKEIVFRPQRMRLACAFFAVYGVGLTVLAAISVFTASTKIHTFQYIYNLETSLCHFVPLAICIFMLIRHKREQTSTQKMVKTILYAEAVLKIIEIFETIIYGLYNFNVSGLYLSTTYSGELMYSGMLDYFTSYLLKFCIVPFIYATVYIFAALCVSKLNGFPIARILLIVLCTLRAGLLIYSGTYSFISSSTLYYTDSTANIFNLFDKLCSSFEYIGVAILLTAFRVEVPIDKTIKNLNERYSDGTIDNSSYEKKRAKLMNQVEKQFKTLEDQYAAGKLDKDSYEAKRAELLSQL